MGRGCSEKQNMKIETLLFHKDEFLDFWTTKCWLKTSQSLEKPLDSNWKLCVMAYVLSLHQENFANSVFCRCLLQVVKLSYHSDLWSYYSAWRADSAMLDVM